MRIFLYYFKRSTSIAIDDLMKKFGLFQYKDVLACHLSGGNKRKLVFAISLSLGIFNHTPKLI